MFACLHLPGWWSFGLPPAQVIANLAGVLVVGLICGALRQRTGTLWAGIAFHLGWNLTYLIVLAT